MQDFEKAGQLRDREMELKAQISAITGAAKETTDAETETSAEGSGPMVTDADIAHIVAQWTGIPVEKVCSPQEHALTGTSVTARLWGCSNASTLPRCSALDSLLLYRGVAIQGRHRRIICHQSINLLCGILAASFQDFVWAGLN